ncbi:MAG: RNA-directed DNA polymerase [Defluviitaleaceae bacterium]|nr:RNA-directed DNA polymerase [Defluviitaleaceae bacterium]
MYDYDIMHDFQKLYAAHKAARRGKRNKTEAIAFEMNLAENLCTLQKELKDRTYQHKGYHRFKIYEPKEREIYAPSYADRVVQHCLCDNILAPALDKRLIYDNAACRVKKGTHFAMDRLSGFMRDFYKKHGTDGYFLKCDIRKYFPSINHEILKGKLKRLFGNSEVFEILDHIIDSYENSPGTGLPLGNQASQWFALYYLDSVDRLIKEKLRIKYYTRYMDDFVLLHHDKEHLRKCLAEIRSMCENELKLGLNEKTQILPLKNGADYLGWHFYITDTGKVIRKLRNSNKKSMKRRFKKMARDYSNYMIDLEKIKHRVTSTHGHLIHGNTYRLRSKLSRETIYTRTKI